MSIVAVLAALVLVALFVISIVALTRVSRRHGGRPGGYDSIAERESRAQVQAEIEEADIEQMIDARNELRRRSGRPSIADELAEEARRERGEDAGG